MHPALRSFLHMLWRQPLYAVPFAIFFGTIFGGRTLENYLDAYVLSLVFSFSVGVAIWTTRYFLAPRLFPRNRIEDTKAIVLEGLLFAGMSVVGSFVAAVILHFTLMPGFLGSPRQFLLISMFALMFGVFGTGLAYAYFFYLEALEKAKSEQELTLARRIQRSFLIEDFPVRPRFEVHAVNISSKQVSGDFYDVVPAGDGSYLIAIADVAGKGVGAALLSSMLQASLRTQADGSGSVARVLANINTLVYRSTAVNQFATFFLARMDERTLTFSYCNAGHNYPIVFRRRGGCEMLERGGTIVGILENVAYEEASIQLEPGDRVVLYTDGINEAANAGGELFGEQRLIAAVEAMPHHLSPGEITEGIVAEVRAFLAGVEPGDDMTVLALRVLEPAAIPATVAT
jgi:hypothetical protein